MMTDVLPDEDLEKLPPEDQHEYILKRHEAFWKSAVDQVIGALRETGAQPGAVALVAMIDHAPDADCPNGARQLAFEAFEVEPGRVADALMKACFAHEAIERLGMDEATALAVANRAAYAPLTTFPATQDIEIIKAAGGTNHVKH